MTQPADGQPRRRNRVQAVLRGFGMLSSLGLGAFSLWLIVTAETVKGTRIGALIGLWALLIAAFAVFGTRHPIPAPAPVADQLAPPGGEVARVEDAAARGEYEHRLIEMLRREITATMSSELAMLRADVSAMRRELVEKVGGQIRLERIETTRVIGSDIEALQHEVRQLMTGGQQLGSFSLGGSHTALMTPTELVHTEPLPAEEVMAEPLQPQPVPVPPQAAKPTTAAPQVAEAGDPFASLPRLRPFTDFEPGPIEVEPEPDDPHAGPRGQNAAADPVNGTGEPAAPQRSRHQNASGDGQSAPSAGGGHRRRSTGGDDDDDMLARILLREGSRH